LFGGNLFFYTFAEKLKLINNIMNSKVTSIVSYFSLIGWLIAFFAGTKDEKSVYHLRQSFGLIVANFVLVVLYRILARVSESLGFVVGLLALVLFVFWIIGLINAINQNQKPIPLIGKYFEGITSIK
jgi:hypothetical protein